MSTYVVIRDMSAGNESVGDMWQETKMFPGDASLDEVMRWAMNNGRPSDNWLKGFSRKRITITKPHEDSE